MQRSAVANSFASILGQRQKRVPSRGSQVSGCGSILQQFITEGVEEDTVDEKGNGYGGGVNVGPLSSS